MEYVLPVLILLVFAAAFARKTPVYDSFIEGAEEGMKTALSLLPPLAAVLSAAAMLRASGAVDALAAVLSPVTAALKIPPEILPLAIIRPLSGGGSVGLLSDIIKSYGPASRIARTACILCASTETTFYTLSVYFRPTGVKYTRRVLAAAVIGDLTGILCASGLGIINF